MCGRTESKKARKGFEMENYREGERLYPIKNDERSVGMPKAKKHGYAAFVAVVILVLAIAVVCAACLNGDHGDWMQAFADFSVSKGFLFWNGGDGGADETESFPENVETSEVTDGTERVSEEKKEDTSEAYSESETDKNEETERVHTVTVDLSEAEKGDGYLIDLTGSRVDTEELLAEGFADGKTYYSSLPAVLIIHTHTSETYVDADMEDPSHLALRGVVSVGEQISSELNRRGIPTVHCTVIHDGVSSLDSYSNAADTIRTMLEIYPSIQYVIDLHRLNEADESGFLMRTEANTSESSAQIRLTVSTGGDLPRNNLILALSLRQKLNMNERRLCMPVVLTGGKMNSDLSRYYLKLDVGGMGNSVSEAKTAGKYFAIALAEILRTK